MFSPCRGARSRRRATSIRCCSLGNRQAAEFIALPGVSEKELADAAQLASLSDETPEGRSIVVLAKEKYGIRGRDMGELQAKFIPFSAYTRLSGIDTGTTVIRKGAVDAIVAFVRSAAAVPAQAADGTVTVTRPLVSDTTTHALNAAADRVANRAERRSPSRRMAVCSALSI